MYPSGWKLKPSSLESSEHSTDTHSLCTILFTAYSLTFFPGCIVLLRALTIPSPSSTYSFGSYFSMKDLPSSATSSISCIDLYGFLVGKSSSSSAILCLTCLPNFSSISSLTSLRYYFSKSLSSAVLNLTDYLRCLIDASSLKSPDIFLPQLLPPPPPLLSFLFWDPDDLDFP